MTRIAGQDVVMPGKRSFIDCYTQPTPERYFETFRRLEYCAPEAAAPAVLASIMLRAELFRRSTVAIADLGCSYGINAMLWRTGRSFVELACHFSATQRAALPTSEAIRHDRRYFDANTSRDWLSVVGLDVAIPALAYGKAMGLLTTTVARDLEEEPLTELDRTALARCELVVATGAIGYLSERTVRAVVRELQTPWVMLFVARTISTGPIEAVLRDQRLETQPLPDLLLRQRRFADADEQSAAVETVRRVQGHEAPRELDGWVYATPVLAAPSASGHLEHLVKTISVALT